MINVWMVVLLQEEGKKTSLSKRVHPKESEAVIVMVVFSTLWHVGSLWFAVSDRQVSSLLKHYRLVCSFSFILTNCFLRASTATSTASSKLLAVLLAMASLPRIMMRMSAVLFSGASVFSNFKVTSALIIPS